MGSCPLVSSSSRITGVLSTTTTSTRDVATLSSSDEGKSAELVQRKRNRSDGDSKSRKSTGKRQRRGTTDLDYLSKLIVRGRSASYTARHRLYEIPKIQLVRDSKSSMTEVHDPCWVTVRVSMPRTLELPMEAEALRDASDGSLELVVHFRSCKINTQQYIEWAPLFNLFGVWNNASCTIKQEKLENADGLVRCVVSQQPKGAWFINWQLLMPWLRARACRPLYPYVVDALHAAFPAFPWHLLPGRPSFPLDPAPSPPLSTLSVSSSSSYSSSSAAAVVSSPIPPIHEGSGASGTGAEEKAEATEGREKKKGESIRKNMQ